MATDLDGIFNVGLKGLRNRKVFDKWLDTLKKLNIGHANYTDSDGVEHTEEGDWSYEVSGFGGDDPLDADNSSMPFEVCFDGPFMITIRLLDDISMVSSFYRLSTLFEQPYFFMDFIDEVRSVLNVFEATEVTWLSSNGGNSYGGIYQSEVWENVPYEQVMDSLIKKFGQPIGYEDAKRYNDEVNWSYNRLDCFVVDRFG